MTEATIQFIKEEAIKAGIKSLMTEKHKSKWILEGGKRGFEMTRTLNSPEEFCKVINERRQKEIEMYDGQEDIDDYWHYRYYTLQIEWMYEMMKYVWGGYESYSARAGIAISRVLHSLKINEYELGYYKSAKAAA